jgi:hypothetical protein
VRRYSPGKGDSSRLSTAPRQSGAPWCGQRLMTAKNSPLTWKTPISRPFTVTILRDPGAISSTRATTWRLIAQSKQ